MIKYFCIILFVQFNIFWFQILLCNTFELNVFQLVICLHTVKWFQESAYSTAPADEAEHYKQKNLDD